MGFLFSVISRVFLLPARPLPPGSQAYFRAVRARFRPGEKDCPFALTGPFCGTEFLTGLLLPAGHGVLYLGKRQNADALSVRKAQTPLQHGFVQKGTVS